MSVIRDTLPIMNRALLAILPAAAMLTLVLSGCTVTTETPTAAETSQSPDLPEASTIEDVWETIGCEADDPLGTRGVISPDGQSPGVERAGFCVPYEDGEIVFFYQQGSPEALDEWLGSGGLEVGATDAVFRDGAVAMLATDAGTAQRFAELFAPADLP